MSREEMLRKFELACGDLPEDAPVLGELARDPRPPFIADRNPDEDLSFEADPPSTLLAMNQVPNYAGGGVGYPGGGYGPAPYFPGFGGLGPGGGGGRNQTPPTGTPTTGSGGDNPPSPPSPPTAEAPEPGSLMLMATGVVGVAGAIRRRRRAD